MAHVCRADLAPDPTRSPLCPAVVHGVHVRCDGRDGAGCQPHVPPGAGPLPKERQAVALLWEVPGKRQERPLDRRQVLRRGRETGAHTSRFEPSTPGQQQLLVNSHLPGTWWWLPPDHTALARCFNNRRSWRLQHHPRLDSQLTRRGEREYPGSSGWAILLSV